MRVSIALAVGLVATVAVIVLASSCSINHASEQYACDDTKPCGPGRTCNDGFCVVTGSIDAAKGDAPRGDGGGNGCPPGCTSCNVGAKTCTINCTLTSCTNSVTCPAGYNCDIQCNTENSCRNGVNCQQSTGCSVTCSGKQACQNVTCGPGACDVECTGVQSCRGVTCGNSCACDVTCTGSQSCSTGINCTSVACRRTLGLGCTSEPDFCHSCQ